jgi:hypothetical protein
MTPEPLADPGAVLDYEQTRKLHVEQQLAAKLAQLGCSRPTVMTTLVEQLPRLPTGKLKRFIPLNE